MIKKVIAGVLSAVLCSTALLSEAPRSNSSTDTTNPAKTAEQQSARNGLEGKNSFGRYLAAQHEAVN
ncbi:MAG: hypothetical protein IKI77_11795 [Oscillospiraceae bacterium]|nr:hypothetical protein [Oscillospiraceae bacterium]